LRAGVPASRVVFTGPGKRDDELRHAVDAGVRAVTVESPSELRRLEAIAATAGARVPVLLRAAVSTADRERVRLIGDGGAGKFGMDVDDLRASARRAARSPHLELLGTHAFGASNVLDAQHIAEHVASTIGMARELADDINVPLRLVDVGGGLGIPYEPDQHPLDLVELGARLTTLTPQLDANAGVRVLIEPGRFLLGPAGVYLSRVVDCKTVNRNAIAVLDGGIHHLLRPALVGQAHRVRRLGTSPATGDAVPATLVGPLCTGLDILAPNAPVGPLQPGDLVAVLDVGAYGFTESMPFFLSHPIPAEVAIRGGEVALLRPRVEPSTWLDRERIPQWSAR
jgi:diaminopimelate decarboxylase